MIFLAPHSPRRSRLPHLGCRPSMTMSAPAAAPFCLAPRISSAPPSLLRGTTATLARPPPKVLLASHPLPLRYSEGQRTLLQDRLRYSSSQPSSSNAVANSLTRRRATPARPARRARLPSTDRTRTAHRRLLRGDADRPRVRSRSRGSSRLWRPFLVAFDPRLVPAGSCAGWQGGAISARSSRGCQARHVAPGRPSQPAQLVQVEEVVSSHKHLPARAALTDACPRQGPDYRPCVLLLRLRICELLDHGRHPRTSRLLRRRRDCHESHRRKYLAIRGSPVTTDKIHVALCSASLSSASASVPSSCLPFRKCTVDASSTRRACSSISSSSCPSASPTRSPS